MGHSGDDSRNTFRDNHSYRKGYSKVNYFQREIFRDPISRYYLAELGPNDSDVSQHFSAS